MGSRIHGNDGRTERTSHGRRRRTPHGGRRRAHIVIPAKAGIHVGGEPAMGSRLHGNDGGRRRTPHGRAAAHLHTAGGGAPTSSFPRRRESTWEGRQGWVPVYTGTTAGGGAPTSSFPRRRESTWGGEPAMGSRLHGNDGGRGAPTSSFPRRRARRTHIVISRDGGNPRGGGELRWIPVYTGTTAGGGNDGDRTGAGPLHAVASAGLQYGHGRNTGESDRRRRGATFPTCAASAHPAARPASARTTLRCPTC